jgi:Na+/glutamate symporter
MPLKMIWMNMFIYAPSVLSGIKEKLEVTDLINQLDIADGLKELLLSSSFTLKSLQNASVSDLAKTLGIDEHVAKLVSDAVNKAIKRSRSIPLYVVFFIICVIIRNRICSEKTKPRRKRNNTIITLGFSRSRTRSCNIFTN